MTSKRTKLGKKLLNAITIDNTTVTLDQWGDTMNITDSDHTATFVKYNRMDVPVMPLGKPPKGKTAKKEWERANKAESEASNLRFKVESLERKNKDLQDMLNDLLKRFLREY